MEPTRGTKGLSYPGPQAILSDPPKPTNRIQTILHPTVPNPPILRSFVPIPNLVRSADAALLSSLTESATPVRPRPNLAQLQPRRASVTREPEPVLPIVAAPTIFPDQPKLLLQPSVPTRPAMPQIEKPKVIPPKFENSKASDSEELSSLQTHGTDVQNLLTLSPTPAPPQQPPNIPSDEARGRFAISPEPNLAPSQPGPGSKSDTSSAVESVGNDVEAAPGNAAAEGPTGQNNGAVRLAIGGAGGLGTGTGANTGGGKGGSGMDNGHGSGVESGLGEGPKNSSGSGTGAGAAHGGGAFSGMTIQGGSLEGMSGGKPVPVTSFPVAPKSSYGMTIVSTASSGGGLPDFGIFSHEQVYTVYLDMRRTLEDPTPTWTLQCALLQPINVQENPAATSSQSLKGLVPPFPLIKDQPILPPELVRKDAGKLIVIYGIVNTKGKFEQMSVRQTPDIQFDRPVLEELSKWVFRPAELSGTPVAVKVLLGFPVSVAEQ